MPYIRLLTFTRTTQYWFFGYGGSLLISGMAVATSPMELTSYNHKATQWGEPYFTLRIAGRSRNWLYLITFTDYICFQGAKQMLTPLKQLVMLANWLDYVAAPTTWFITYAICPMLLHVRWGFFLKKICDVGEVTSIHTMI
jgi:hypothetical protein